MPRVSKFDLLAEKEGKPLRDVLVRRLNEVQTIENLAANIHVTVAYTSRKLKKLNIKRKSIWVYEGTDDAE